MTEHVGNEGSVASRFTRSVNIQQDLWQAESLQGYHVTAGARRALLRIAPARHAPEVARAWTLTGPYGTGKSALGLFTAKLLASDFVPGHAAAWKLLRSSDPDLAQHIRPPRKAAPALLPIVITGSREPLQLAILRGLQVAIGHLHSRRCSHVMGRINESLAQAISGKQPSAHAITELFAEALRVASVGGEVGGFFLVLDELGKLLEYAAAHPANSDLYTLQSLAEFAARVPQPFLILGILHQDFSLYADRLTGRERAEWDKIRGRFEDIAFEEPVDELLRLIAEARSQSSEGVKLDQLSATSRKHFRSLCEQAWRLQLAPQHMIKREFCDLLSRCYPLHPLAALALGPLFRKLAQNERSVFSFLESSEPHGLRDHLQVADGRLYCLHDLYDYLLGSIGESLYVQIQGKRWAEIETVLARLANGGNLSLKGLTDNINYAQNLTVNGNSGLNINTDATLQHATWSGNITLNSGATLGVGGGWSGSGVLNISGRVSGGGALNVVNPDTVILSGNSNTYTGKTTVSSGTLTAGAANALSANSDMTVNGGTLDVSGYATTVKSLTLSSGTLDLGTGNVMTAGGAANFNGGTIALSGSATLGKYTLARASSAIGTVSSATSGVPAYYHVSANGSELDLTHYATVGSIFATPSSTQIIVGGSTPVSVTVGNSAPVNSDNLSFSVTPGGNMSGSGSGTAAAGGNSGPVSGLSFTGSTVGAGQTGYFTVSDPNATNNLQPGSVSVDVFDHSNASLSATSNQTSQTIDFGNVLKGATVPTQSFSVYNRAANTTAAYTANLKLTGSTASGDASLNAAVSPFGGLSAGGYVTYTASLNTSNYTTTGTKTVSMSASQLTDDSNLSGAGNNNNGAMNIVLQGNVGNATADNSNSPSTFGSALTAGVAKGGTYANLESTVRATSGNGGASMLGSTATILDGTASAATAVSMAWRTRTTAETTRAGGGLISDVVSLSGIAPNGTGLHDGIRQTDMFVLQMSYDPSELFRLWGLTEAQAVAQNDLQLKYLDPGTDGLIGISNDSWTGAVDGNFGGTPNYVGDHAYDSSYFVLGDYGVDTTNHVVWAVVDYSGVFAVPEPSSCILLGIGAVSLLAWGWRRLRAA